MNYLFWVVVSVVVMNWQWFVHLILDQWNTLPGPLPFREWQHGQNRKKEDGCTKSPITKHTLNDPGTIDLSMKNETNIHIKLKNGLDISLQSWNWVCYSRPRKCYHFSNDFQKLNNVSFLVGMTLCCACKMMQNVFILFPNFFVYILRKAITK